MRAVIYARFSSERQREESIEGQVRECQEFAQRNNFSIVNTYIDRALSASKDTEKRLDFLRMIKDSSKQLFDVVLVWKLDRFARSRYDSAHYKHILKKNGIRVVSATENITEGPEGIILESMLEGMAEYYSAELSEKIQRGQKENALKCRNNGGRVPLGYRVNKTTQQLEIEPLTAPIVREIFQRYADGESIRDIVNDLNNRGLRTSRNCRFSYSAFNLLLQNRKYIGEYKYGKVVIPHGIPAIIQENIFQRVQERMAKNKQAPAAAKASEAYILTTKLFCGQCGTMMVGESGVGSKEVIYRYYKCSHAKRKKGCTKKAIKKEWIENLVVEKTLQIALDENLLQKIADRVVETQTQENYSVRLLKKSLSETQKSIDNLVSAIEAGIITPATKQRLIELEAQKETLEKSIVKEQLEHPLLSKEQILAYLYQFKKFNHNDTESKQRLIDCFVNAVYVYDDKIVLTFNYKHGTKTVSLAEVNSSDLESFSPPKTWTHKRPGFFFATNASPQS